MLKYTRLNISVLVWMEYTFLYVYSYVIIIPDTLIFFDIFCKSLKDF